MPIIRKIETDMFRFANVCDYMVNPVNLVGAPGKGLALKFRQLYPEYVEQYRAACREGGGLKFGTIKVISTEGKYPWDMICLPTKDHYAEHSEIKNIKRGLEAMRSFLIKRENARSVVGMPMLGCGLGKQDYATVEPVIDLYLDAITPLTILSMSPDRTSLRPDYLVVIGPPRFGEKKEEREKIAECIPRVLKAKWNKQLDDFDAIVSGGETTADRVVCGALDDKSSVEKCLAQKWLPNRRIIAPLNWSHNKLTAGIRHIQLLSEIGTHFILLMPPGYNNNRMIHIQRYIKQHNENYAPDVYGHKRMCVVGKNSDTLTDETPITIQG